MDERESLSHTKWECNTMGIHPQVPQKDSVWGNCDGTWARCSANSRSKRRVGSKKVHLMPDHVHMMVAIPPKHAVPQVIGFIKGQSRIQLARVYGEKKRNFVGQHFWVRGYFVSPQPGTRR